MPRSSYYLLALLLSFIATFLWFSSSVKSSTKTPILTLAYGSCSCPPGSDQAKTDLTPSSPPIKPSSSLPTGITITSPSPIPPLHPSSDSTPEPPTSYYLPYTPTTQLSRHPFPSKLWQKAGPNGINEDRQKDIQSWLSQNPSLRHEIFTDGSAEQYVRDQFSKFPDIIDTYTDLQVPILKADFLRQLILYADGGVWSDLDVTCHIPISAWIPDAYKNATNLVVGLEFDGNQFASWTVMAKPRSSHIAAAIEYIMDALEDSAEQANTTISGLTMKTISDVVAVTGPQAMTRAILQSVSRELGERVEGGNVSGLHEPVLLRDVLVLPNAAFGAMQAGWPTDQGPYLVEHHYAGSWKNDHGGESGGDKDGSGDGSVEKDGGQEEEGGEGEGESESHGDSRVKSEIRER
ncbi:uncharacterized protein N7496_003375 [Penicillium cataractarum]|uniref:Initiation-specific alpha-1,6-mannosyltransferase n=1 Tax=Penicillium cataractarum TaxID=2100454 RepID=A0A9W9SM02_9EURO|nr:uncharacterized protein N7496_003375 [Penicillium cataractarum]KAJ5380947.1 hypothetical protein N7496_003375 [Penicillium cataractarum]